ncbi:uncharacterized protein LOC121249493 [Juglans microcarpa x Juglans regia]|uniref:uncharacterized protein LOC121249493 n=1 Tax=Juglans microcarpa x Juglans regia TaxID=2249226 RepID=UPI001B7E7363|nr:uncharacterized protein LOC121249493 [Juglans microcarpa x Juglans regia]
MGTMRFDIEKFTGENDFGLSRIKMRRKTKIVQKDIIQKAHSALILSLGDKVLRDVASEDTAAGHFKKNCPERKNNFENKPKEAGDASVVLEGYESTEILTDIPSEAGVLRVTKGSLVIMKVIIKNDLYTLLGKTMVGETFPTQNTGENQAVLWHRRLRHVDGLGRYMCVISRDVIFNESQMARVQGDIPNLEADNSFKGVAGNVDTRKSLTGYVFTAFGGAISWKSHLQSVVALSTTEAEYIALTEAVKEAIWLKGIASELNIYNDNITVHRDNQSTLH